MQILSKFGRKGPHNYLITDVSVTTVKGGVKLDHWGGEKVDHFLGS